MINTSSRIRALIDRLARLEAKDHWTDDLNPAQWTALDYLSRANRFSRSPSQIAEYLGATRGTVSQTLRALARKDYVEEERSTTDRRSISYVLTDRGHAVVGSQSGLGPALTGFDANRLAVLESDLENLLRAAIKAHGSRSFGLCRTCRHHTRTPTGGYCKLLDLNLKPKEADEICFDHAA